MRIVATLVGTLLLTLSAGANGKLLISGAEAVKLHTQPNVVFVMGDNSEVFEAGHIPGSMHMESHGLQCSDSAGKLDCPPLYQCEKDAEKFIGERGIDNKTLVIAYDDYRGPNATGIYHFFRLYGHENVKILNGGLEAWKKAGGKVATGPAKLPAKPKSFKVKVDMSVLATKEQMAAGSQNIMDTVAKTGSRAKAKYALIDSRSMAEAIGERKVDNVARGGHVPGATLMEWLQVSGAEEKLSYPSNLTKVRQKLEAAGITKDKTIYTYCHVGAGRGSYYYVLLKELLGYPNVRVYTGGWNEWGNDMNLPIRR